MWQGKGWTPVRTYVALVSELPALTDAGVWVAPPCS